MKPKHMIGVKRDFFFKSIEQEVVALIYKVAQERNYDTKNPKTSGGGEMTFVQKET